jgi:hypothetical protein
MNKKYPEILGICFDGTAFGVEEAPIHLDQPTIDVRKRLEVPPDAGGAAVEPYDDDIPF